MRSIAAGRPQPSPYMNPRLVCRFRGEMVKEKEQAAS